MRFFKSVLIGLVSGLAAVVVWTLLKIALSVQLTAGAGGIGFVISEIEILVAAIVGYCAGFFWYRRAKQSKPASPRPT
jgi:UDP-N-acetylmuramyl pentapeptide phosphotransferase/UDP-N-acetylglucosamine-1-phosphate transferase